MKRIVLALALIVVAFVLVACGGGGSSSSTSASGINPASEGTTDGSGSSPVREIEERCKFASEELHANPSEAASWKATLDGCEEELKDAEEPDRVAREERKNEVRLNKERRAYREEQKAKREAREAHYESAISRVKAKLRESKAAEIEALKELCSASISEAVAEEERTGSYLREYWRECR